MRFLKGGAAAFTAPAGLSIITTTFPEGVARNRALFDLRRDGCERIFPRSRPWRRTHRGGWRWVLIVPGPLALALMLLVVRAIPRDRVAANRRRDFDVPGGLTLTAGMLLLVWAIVQAPNHGWDAGSTVGGFVAAAALLASFLRIERRTRVPLVRLGFCARPGLYERTSVP